MSIRQILIFLTIFCVQVCNAPNNSGTISEPQRSKGGATGDQMTDDKNAKRDTPKNPDVKPDNNKTTQNSVSLAYKAVINEISVAYAAKNGSFTHQTTNTGSSECVTELNALSIDQLIKGTHGLQVRQLTLNFEVDNRLNPTVATIDEFMLQYASAVPCNQNGTQTIYANLLKDSTGYGGHIFLKTSDPQIKLSPLQEIPATTLDALVAYKKILSFDLNVNNKTPITHGGKRYSGLEITYVNNHWEWRTFLCSDKDHTNFPYIFRMEANGDHIIQGNTDYTCE